MSNGAGTIALRRAAGTVLALAAGLAAAEPLQEVPLGQPALAATAAGRADLKYLAHCALDHRTVLVAEVEGSTYRFTGQIGLAPRWFAQPMDDSEQRWVSACLLALQNHTGAQVPVSLLLSARPNPGVRGGWLDAGRQYPVPEGRFFGNLFADPPRAYVCSPDWTEAQARALRARQRLCALPGPVDPDGRRRSVCATVHVGPCSGTALTQDGQHHAESVQAFLPGD